ncbi:hypothetical protein [Pseudarthrobacter sp. fls2-241-R2A-127]|uniref:hypothetical protein n=1 Tax=Pseudarthrobacter sp. fls2-241-R2A-127 TaxID=3040303 RepID=UPI002553F41E|nr:hypothetical protein [Pseudarthrobacter sp. fls2-241-R2A-127]
MRNRRARRVHELIRRIKAEKELREFPDCQICTPRREVNQVNDVGARALGVTHEPGCPLAEPEDGPAAEYDVDGNPL